MKKNSLALILIAAALLSSVAELRGWLLPTLSWPFSVSRQLSFLSAPPELCPALAADGRVHWFGWMIVVLLIATGFYLLLRPSSRFKLSPQARRSITLIRA